MKISILLALYNSEPFIERCLQSIVLQSFTNYEVVLVDDASQDKGLQLAEQFLKKHQIAFQSIKHKKNEYLATTRNTGIKGAKGKYIMFMDQDDELAHNEVLTQFHEAIEREQADFVTANHKIIYSDTNTREGKKVSKATLFQNKGVLEAFLYTKIHMSAWNKLINKDFLLNNNLLFQKGLLVEDELWAFQMCLVAKKVYCLPYYNYNYYKDIPTAITKNINKKYYEDNIYTLKKQLEIAKEKQLINNKNTNAFIFHFKRMSQKVLRPKILENKELWIDYYKQISNIYKQSELWQHKKLFRLPAPIAYFLQKEQRKKYTFKGSRFYIGFINKIFQYNWNGAGFFTHSKNRLQHLIHAFVIKHKKFQVEDSIIICGERRSGTTWLLRVVSQIPNTYINFEPFNRWGVVPKNWQWGEFPYLPQNKEDKTTYQFIHNVLTLKTLSLWGLWATRLKNQSFVSYLYKNKQIVTKFVMANSLLPYMVNNFNLRNKPILIVRHPIDVCLSQIRAFDAKEADLTEVIPNSLNNERFIKESDYLHRLETRLEYKVAIWCINMCLLLQDKETLHKVTVVFYSDLLLNPEKETRRIFKTLKSLNNLDIDNIIASIDYRKPSGTDFKNDLKHDPTKQLEKNIEKLSEEEKERIQNVFDHFNFKLYDAYSVFPKKEYLK